MSVNHCGANRFLRTPVYDHLLSSRQQTQGGAEKLQFPSGLAAAATQSQTSSTTSLQHLIDSRPQRPRPGIRRNSVPPARPTSRPRSQSTSLLPKMRQQIHQRLNGTDNDSTAAAVNFAHPALHASELRKNDNLRGSEHGPGSVDTVNQKYSPQSQPQSTLKEADLSHFKESPNTAPRGSVLEAPYPNRSRGGSMPPVSGTPGPEQVQSQPPDTPPVTKGTLSELDLPKIIKNPKLRHDINYDSDLHFRPNEDGERGMKKAAKARAYWNALEFALTEITLALRSDKEPPSESMKRIELAFKTIQDILKTLVPPREHEVVDESLDIILLMQRLRKNQHDFVNLAVWLASLLKQHCAPMRDQMVDSMVADVRFGTIEDDVSKLVEGLGALFGILEAMKLDIANHQIRSLRHLLIEDTVKFEHDYFLRRITDNRIDTEEAEDWFRAIELEASHIPLSSPNLQRHFFNRLVQTIVPAITLAPVEKLPTSTFQFDDDRLQNIILELKTLLNLRICHDVYCSQVLGRRYDPSHPSFHQVRHFVLPVITDEAGDEIWDMTSINDIALEIARRIPAVRYNHWSLAYEAQRVMNYLQEALNPTSSISRNVTDSIHNELEDLILHYLGLYESMVPSMIADSWKSEIMSNSFPTYLCLLHDIARRVAHIGLLHWKVWGPLVYMKDLSEGTETG